MQYTVYGEVHFDSNPDFVLIISFHGGLYDPLTQLLYFGDRGYGIPAGRQVKSGQVKFIYMAPNHNKVVSRHFTELV